MAFSVERFVFKEIHQTCIFVPQDNLMAMFQEIVYIGATRYISVKDATIFYYQYTSFSVHVLIYFNYGNISIIVVHPYS